MKKVSTLIGYVIVLSACLCLNGLFNQPGVSAQSAQDKAKGQEPPLVKPLERDDPRAQLNPELLNAQPMPFPTEMAPV